AVDAANVYWRSGASVVRAPKQGGPPVTLFSDPELGSSAIDEANVYSATCTTDANQHRNGTIMVLPKAGGAPTDLVSGQGCPESIVDDATNIYWSAGGNIFTVPKSGGAPLGLGAGGDHIMVDAVALYFTTYMNRYPGAPHSCADEHSTIGKMSKTGGA